jgi:Cation efflux family
MSADCCDHRDLADPHRGNAAYRRVLWAVLAINAVMFVVEIGAGLATGSAALQADALDFFGDAANYGISLFVVGMALRYRAMAALAKGGTMGLAMGDGDGSLARGAWHLAQRLHHGRRRLRRFGGQCCFLRPALGLSWRRCEHALSMDLHA